jgi:uncharacterized protein YhdP
VEPGVGRLLGILNLNALQRRLAMDFSDLYATGLAFESMRGRVRLINGKADFNDFTIDGPSSRIIISGLNDLVGERFDQAVIVEPKLGSSVALASAFAGGPVVGAAVYVVDRLAGHPFDRLGRTRYRVSGPWGSPEVIRIGWEPALGDAPEATSGDTGAAARDDNHFLE